jgi:hypothetical protein
VRHQSAIRILLLAGAVFLATAQPVLHAETTDFSRYQVILDHTPFGPVTGGPDTALPNFTARYLFVAVVSSNGEDGVLQAIIQDKEANRSYFRGQGETLDNNVKVLRIEAKPAKLVLQSGLEVGTLTFQERTAAAAGPVAAPGAPGIPGAPPPMPTPTGVRRIPFRRGN